MTKDDMLAQLAAEAEFNNSWFGWTRVMTTFSISLADADILMNYGERIGMLERIPESGVSVRFVPEKLSKMQLELNMGDLWIDLQYA